MTGYPITMQAETVQAGCNAADIHRRCSYPECNCKQMPAIIKAALSEALKRIETLTQERDDYKQASLDCHDALGKCAMERDEARRSAEAVRYPSAKTAEASAYFSLPKYK